MAENFGLEAYILEPVFNEQELQEREANNEAENGIAGDDAEEEDMEARVGNVLWCQCENCVAMPTVKECLCCNEDSANLLDKLYEGNMDCVTDHPDFEAVCLTETVLEILMYALREVRGYGQLGNWENR